jgi:hypothetical protein
MEANKPAWVELSTTDPAGAREFYKKLFGWRIEVSQDPQYGGYGLAYTGDENVAGIGGKRPGDASPSNWGIYIGTEDADATAKKIAAAGGTVVVAPFDVPAQGRMTVFQDPSGAFLSAWQAKAHQGFTAGGQGQFGWAELSARGIDKVQPFYRSVFGWNAKTSAATAPDAPAYTEFQIGGESIAGGMEMPPMVPKEVPSYWMPYFNVSDVDAAFTKARDAGAREMVAPKDFPGGRFAIVQDPQGAAFGLLKAQPRQ